MNKKKLTRRDFIKSTTVASVAASVIPTAAIHAAGSDILKVGIIGCGGRGTGAVTQAIAPKAPTKLWAMADVFRDELDACYNILANGAKGRYDREDTGSLLDRMDVPEKRKFSGFNAYKQLLETEIDYGILSCPPHFRPRHFEAQVQADKHVFME